MTSISGLVSLPNIAQFLLTILSLYILQTFVYAFFQSPVRHIPGPWWARVSQIPLKRAILQSRRSSYASSLLQKYGRVVVIAPGQVHTNDPDAMKTIYNKNSRKTDFYANQGTWKGVTNTLGHRTYADAAPMRRRMLSCFSDRNLAKLVQNISSHVNDLVNLIDKHRSEDLNIAIPMRLFALDVIADVLWGEQNCLLTSYEDGTVPPFLRRFNAFSTYSPMKSFLPGFDTYVSYFGTARWRKLRKDAMDVDLNVREALARWNGCHDERDKDVLSMLKSMEAEDRLPDDYIPAHMVEMLGAGSVTTALTACHVCWQLAHHDDVQSRLREELKTALPDITAMDLWKTNALPLLDAVIRETMRVKPIIPGPQQRILGDDLVVSNMTVGQLHRTILGQRQKNAYKIAQIPRGTIASCAAHDQQRLGSVFSDPESWVPSLWLDGNATDAMHYNWIPFGYGARQCPGLNLGLTELKYIIGTLFRRFHVMPPKQQELDGNETQDTFLAVFKRGALWLRFEDVSLK